MENNIEFADNQENKSGKFKLITLNMKKGLILYLTVIVFIFIHISFLIHYKNFIEPKTDMASYGFISKSRASGIQESYEYYEEFRKYCESNIDKCKGVLFKRKYYVNEYLTKAYYELPIFFGKKCYSGFSDGVYDSKWQESYGFGKNLEQFVCYGMLDGGGFPGYPASFLILFFISFFFYFMGKIFKKDMLISIGKYIFSAQIVLIILVFVFFIMLGLAFR